jgi:hypothetical protein
MASLVLFSLGACAHSNDAPQNAPPDGREGGTKGRPEPSTIAQKEAEPTNPQEPRPTCLPHAALVKKVDAARMLKDLRYLVGLGERRSPQGQALAARYLKAELSKLPPLGNKEQSYRLSEQTYVNIEASLVGSQTPTLFVFAAAHYDSTSDDPLKAPGADDNASGTVAVLEAARVLSSCQPQRSIRWLFFSNEEKNTAGATHYVQSIKKVIPPSQLVGLLNMDMVGYGPPEEDLDLATKPAYQSLMEQVKAAIERWTPLKVKPIIGEHCG